MTRYILCLLLMFRGVEVVAVTNAPSTSVQLDGKAMVEAVRGLQQYENVARLSGKLISAGSGTGTAMMNHWAAEFNALYPEVELDIRGGGANTNVLNAFVDGTIDLVPISRALPAETSAAFKAKYGYEPTQITIAPDALGVYVNKNNPVAGLTLGQLELIFSRTPKSDAPTVVFWGDLGVNGPLASESISRYALSQRHGAHMLFRSQVLNGAEYKFSTRFEGIHTSLIQAVGADDAGIAFDSVMFATARTRLVPLKAADGQFLLPTLENVRNGQYPLTRPIQLVFNRKPGGGLKPVVREYLRFAVSRRGQYVNAMDGGFPLTPDQQKEALIAIGGNR